MRLISFTSASKPEVLSVTNTNMAAKQEQELNLFELARAKVAEAQKIMTEARDLASSKMSEARDLLEKDLNNAREEKVAIEEITKTLNHVHFASTIKLNVGGKIYKTTLDTLRKDPDSMLCAMFSGRFTLKADDEDGAYFIDRDAELFRYILNYLRNCELLCPEDKIIRKELLAEAKFYQVQGIIKQLEEAESPFGDSLILENESHHSTLKSWLPVNATFSLLFRATVDGKTAADFHRCCDNKGPTLVVIKSGEYIGGGFTTQSWESAESLKAKEDSQSFLFTLVNFSGSEPAKLSQKSGGGIRCSRDSGPHFGTSICSDLLIWYQDPPPSSYSYLGLGHGFKRPNTVDRAKHFFGSSPFTVEDLEVFEVKF